jgi:8-oxo-dGTP diphosphatase
VSVELRNNFNFAQVLLFIALNYEAGYQAKIMTEVKFYEPGYDPPGKLIYAIIVSKYSGKWLFVRHKQRSTFEVPAGHIEENETPDEAAVRELREETGAQTFTIDCIATYSVSNKGVTGYGRLYFADISELGPLPGDSEIGEVLMSGMVPENLTHPDVQPHLIRKIADFLSGITKD